MRIAALSLHRPWADALMAGLKRVETRPYPTKHRGWLAIHTTQDTHEKQYCTEPGFERIKKYVPDLPHGHVVGIANLVACVKLTQSLSYTVEGYRLVIGPQEHFYGHYAPQRFAWLFSEVRRFAVPVPATGHQRIWTWETDALPAWDVVPYVQEEEGLYQPVPPALGPGR